MSIEVEGLYKIYGTQKALNNVSFSINTTGVTGFLGPNGAGKSTTMKILTGYIVPEKGKVKVCGLHLNENVLSVKKNIGYLSEHNPLYHDFYVKEYLSFVAGIHQTPNKNKRIEEVLSLTGLIIEQNKKIAQLSKGYKQRVGLAAAIIHEPKVLILDEPTTGLDPNQITEIRSLIKDYGKKNIVLFSSHIMQEVEAVCNRAIIIHKGNIVADNNLADLKSIGKTKQVFLETDLPLDTSSIHQFKAVSWIEGNHYVFETDEVVLLKKEIIQAADNQQINIVSLSSKEIKSMEEVFKLLTKE